ncbi:MAG: NfeD family protein, partial [Lachnospiraceae bacterium]|nr:NfeD family protein [Lachnospiraceae bacterium]
AGLVSLTGAHWLVQVLVFAFVSLILFLLARPIAEKHLMKDIEKTNVESLIGKECIVLEDIDNIAGTGSVRLNGMEWTARSTDGTSIDEGAKVIVQSISGVKLMVTKKENECMGGK